MDKDDKKIIKRATITVIVVAFVLALSLCVAGLIFSLPNLNQ